VQNAHPVGKDHNKSSIKWIIKWMSYFTTDNSTLHYQYTDTKKTHKNCVTSRCFEMLYFEHRVFYTSFSLQPSRCTFLSFLTVGRYLVIERSHTLNSTHAIISGECHEKHEKSGHQTGKNIRCDVQILAFVVNRE
jgi:hypothetical protein